MKVKLKGRKMISKELLSKVLGYEVKEVLGMLENSANKTILSYIFEDASLNEGKRIINIYELAHKCKEWAYRRGFLIGSNCRQGITVIDINTHTVLNHFDVYIEDFTEFEIKACQWILENK